MTDGIFISQFAGSEQLSATNIVYPVVYLLNGIGVMLSMGGNVGVLCMMPFLYQYDFHIFPDFESETFYIRGSYDVKGRIQLIFLLVTAIRLLADKDIRSFLKKLLDHRE